MTDECQDLVRSIHVARAVDPVEAAVVERRRGAIRTRTGRHALIRELGDRERQSSKVIRAREILMRGETDDQRRSSDKRTLALVKVSPKARIMEITNPLVTDAHRRHDLLAHVRVGLTSGGDRILTAIEDLMTAKRQLLRPSAPIRSTGHLATRVAGASRLPRARRQR